MLGGDGPELRSVSPNCSIKGRGSDGNQRIWLDSSLLYINKVSGSYSSPVVLAQGATNQEQGYYANIIVVPAGKVHVIHTNYHDQLRYITNASGPFVSTQINGNVTGYADYSTFSRNSSGDLAVVFTTPVYPATLKCARLPGGAGSTWTVTTLFTPGGGDAEDPTCLGGVITDLLDVFGLFDYAPNLCPVLLLLLSPAHAPAAITSVSFTPNRIVPDRSTIGASDTSLSAVPSSPLNP